MPAIILAADPLPSKSHPRPLFCPHAPAGARHETEPQIPVLPENPQRENETATLTRRNTKQQI